MKVESEHLQRYFSGMMACACLFWGKDAPGRCVEDRLRWEEAGGIKIKCGKPLQYTSQKKIEA